MEEDKSLSQWLTDLIGQYFSKGGGERERARRLALMRLESGFMLSDESLSRESLHEG